MPNPLAYYYISSNNYKVAYTNALNAIVALNNVRESDPNAKLYAVGVQDTDYYGLPDTNNTITPHTTSATIWQCDGDELLVWVEHFTDNFDSAQVINQALEETVRLNANSDNARYVVVINE